MKNITLLNITEATQKSFDKVDDARVRYLIQKLIEHLHLYAKETQITHEEWRDGLNFLHKSGEISDQSRSEFTLLSDVLGLSSLIDLLASKPNATEGSVLGPFHTRGSPWFASGANLIHKNEGEPTLLRGRITDVNNQAINSAVVDFWQNANNGMYWQMDDKQPQDNLRCQMRVEEDGSFELLTIRPKPYMVPTDGPVGQLLGMGKRNAWRPAHFHIIVEAPGYKSLITELFDSEDPYIEQCAVFGVRESLVKEFKLESNPELIKKYGLTGAYLAVDCSIKLVKNLK